jgi:hypothetical protein
MTTKKEEPERHIFSFGCSCGKACGTFGQFPASKCISGECRRACLICGRGVPRMHKPKQKPKAIDSI